jgi:uncharacterized small protein (TIGR04563 family)
VIDRSTKRKQSLYMPEDMLLEVMAEAARQDRSLSWVVQHAWKIAKARIGAMPAGHAGEPSAHESLVIDPDLDAEFPP